MNASQKVAQYLGEAKASEDALVRVLQSQIAMTPTGRYRTALETHLTETRGHSQRLDRRLGELDSGRGPLQFLVNVTEEVIGQTLALSKTPLDLMRGGSAEEKVLKNAKDGAAGEALEIATYTALEQLAESVGDARSAELARSIKADEEKMLERILQEIPALTDAVVRAELKDDPSYDITRTGAADAVRAAGEQVGQAVEDAQVATRRTARQARKVPGVAQAEGAVKGAVADAPDLPIANYDARTAEEISHRLPGLSQIDLAKIGVYERGHADRSTITDRVETLRGDEPWPGYDELNAADVQAALADADHDRLTQVRTHERAHKNRAGVLKAAERQLASA